MKFFCNYEFLNEEIENLIINQFDEKLKSIIYAIGKEKMKALGYNITKISKAIGVVIFDPANLGNHIRSTFKIGDKYSLADIKIKLQDLYKNINYNKTAKATDLIEFFEVSECLLTRVVDGEKKRVKGYELLNYKKLNQL